MLISAARSEACDLDALAYMRILVIYRPNGERTEKVLQGVGWLKDETRGCDFRRNPYYIGEHRLSTDK